MFTTQYCAKREALLSYHGTFISEYDASKCIDQSFLFHFEFNGKNGTNSTCMAKYMNDSTPQHVNCRMEVKCVDTVPHLTKSNKKYITANVELRYDDGDKKELLPWRINPQMLIPRNLLALKKMECEQLLITKQCESNPKQEEYRSVKTIPKTCELFSRRENFAVKTSSCNLISPEIIPSVSENNALSCVEEVANVDVDTCKGVAKAAKRICPVVHCMQVRTNLKNHSRCQRPRPNLDDDEYLLDPSALGPSVETLLQKFHDYMVGPDRQRKGRSIIVVVGDICRIFQAVGVKDDLSIVFQENGAYLRDKYIIQHCGDKETKAISIKKCLYSLMDFCDFLLVENIAVRNVDTNSIYRLHSKMKQGRKNLYQKEKLDVHVRRAKDEEMLVTVDQVKRYQEGSNCKAAVNIFEKQKLNINLALHRSDFCLIRDHLYINIAFSNAQRSGATANMTIPEFQAAKLQQNGQMLI